MSPLNVLKQFFCKKVESGKLKLWSKIAFHHIRVSCLHYIERFYWINLLNLSFLLFLCLGLRSLFFWYFINFFKDKSCAYRRAFLGLKLEVTDTHKPLALWCGIVYDSMNGHGFKKWSKNRNMNISLLKKCIMFHHNLFFKKIKADDIFATRLIFFSSWLQITNILKILRVSL